MAPPVPRAHPAASLAEIVLRGEASSTDAAGARHHARAVIRRQGAPDSSGARRGSRARRCRPPASGGGPLDLVPAPVGVAGAAPATRWGQCELATVRTGTQYRGRPAPRPRPWLLGRALDPMALPVHAAHRAAPLAEPGPGRIGAPTDTARALGHTLTPSWGLSTGVQPRPPIAALGSPRRPALPAGQQRAYHTAGRVAVTIPAQTPSVTTFAGGVSSRLPPSVGRRLTLSPVSAAQPEERSNTTGTTFGPSPAAVPGCSATVGTVGKAASGTPSAEPGALDHELIYHPPGHREAPASRSQRGLGPHGPEDTNRAGGVLPPAR
jgi:hypothetical protein